MNIVIQTTFASTTTTVVIIIDIFVDQGDKVCDCSMFLTYTTLYLHNIVIVFLVYMSTLNVE